MEGLSSQRVTLEEQAACRPDCVWHVGLCTHRFAVAFSYHIMGSDMNRAGQPSRGAASLILFLEPLGGPDTIVSQTAVCNEHN